MYINNDDTIYAPATVPGTGAVSIIRISGKDALTIADKVITCKRGNISEAKGYSIKFGVVRLQDGTVLDEVLASVFRAPHSYTGENSVEISCHASAYIADTLMQLLMTAGARAAGPGEFTQRAFLNGKMDLAQAEAVADVIASQNASAHKIAFKQMKGGFSSELKDMREELLKIVSLMELELDFSEEEVEFADRKQLNALLERVLSHISKLIGSFKLGNAIKNGIPVAIAGATNTGKSTLLNALLGEERAIVSDVHGTTRDTVEETLNIDGAMFRFIDTAGIRETSETIEKIGIERTFKKIGEADIILAMVDASRSDKEIEESLTEVFSKIEPEEQTVTVLMNKVDLMEESCVQNKTVFITNLIISLFDKYGINVCVTITDSDKVGELHQSSHNNETRIRDYVNESDYRNYNKDGHDKSDTTAVSTEQSGKDSIKIPVIRISAKNKTGIESLRNILATKSKALDAGADTTLVTNIRHIEALTNASTALTRVQNGLACGIPTDLAAQDIREALYYIGSIVGEISTDEVLGNIFRNFCIGK